MTLTALMSFCLTMCPLAATRVSPTKHDFVPGESTLTALKGFFTNGDYWNHKSDGEDDPYSVTDTACSTSTDADGLHTDIGVVCNYFEVPGKVVGGWQCCGFARMMTYLYFGSSFENWETSTSLKDISAGDVIYLYSSGPHYIWIQSVKDNGDGTVTALYTDCNGAGRRSHCQIQWDVSATLDTVDNLVLMDVLGSWEVVRRYKAPLESKQTKLADSFKEVPLDIACEIRYENNGTYSSKTKLNLKGNLVFSETIPTKAGYSFVGWTLYRDSDKAWYTGSGHWTVDAKESARTQFAPRESMSVERLTMEFKQSELITAKPVWQENTIAVVYHANGGSVSGDYKVASSSNGTIMRAVDGKKYSESFLYTAVSKKDWNGLATAKTFGLSRKGFQFAGWVLQPQNHLTITGSQLSSRCKTGNASLVAYALWMPKLSFANLNANGGSVLGNQLTVNKDGLLMAGTSPIRYICSASSWAPQEFVNADELRLFRYGYEFTGWSETAGSGTKILPKDLALKQNGATDPVTIYAMWEAKDVIFSFYISSEYVESSEYESLNGYIAKGGKTYTQSYDLPSFQISSLPTATEFGISRRGYAFKGWSLNGDTLLTQQEITTETFGEDTNVTLKPLWNPYVLTVSFNKNGGESVDGAENMDVAYPDLGNVLQKRAIRTGYRFVGWGLSPGMSNPIDLDKLENMIAKQNAKSILYAIWQKE